MRNRSKLLLVSSSSSSLICKAFQGSIPSPVQSTQCCHASNMGLRRLFWVRFDIIPMSALKQHQFPRGFHDTSPWNKSYVRLRQHDSKEENTAKNFGGSFSQGSWRGWNLSGTYWALSLVKEVRRGYGSSQVDPLSAIATRDSFN